MVNLLIGLVVPIAVLATFAFARRHLAASSMKPPEGQYQHIPFGGTWLVNISIVLVGAFFAVTTHAAFAWLNRYLAFAKGPAELWLWPQSAIWWFFPGFGALVLSWEIVLQLWSNLGNREKAYSYNYWWAQTAGFDSTRMLRWMAALIVPPIGILTVLALSMHTALRRDDIQDCGYAFAPCQIYRYADGRRMTAIEGSRNREGTLVRRAGIVINFNDGRRWSSADIGDFNENVDPELIEFLERKTHLPLNRAETEADILGLAFEPKRERH